MPLPRLICPACKVRLDKMRLSQSGAKYGCGKCGKWFASQQLAPDDGDAAGTSGESENRLHPVQSPELHGLTRMSIVLGLKAATLPEAVGELVPKALHGTGKAFLRSAEIADALRERLASETLPEFRGGLAFLHLRVDDLREQRAAMGISAEGLSPGGNVLDKAFVVLLFLRPSRQPGYDVPLWARRKLCNERTVYKLKKAPDVETVFRILHEA